MEDGERDRRQKQDPKELVAEISSEDRVGRDSGRVVVGQTGENPRSGDRSKRDQPFTAAYGVNRITVRI